MVSANWMPNSPDHRRRISLLAGAAIPEREGQFVALRFAALALIALFSLNRIAHAAPAAEDDFTAARARMMTVIRANAEAIGSVAGASISQRVLEVMARVPRHEFVPEDLRGSAYDDRPLP